MIVKVRKDLELKSFDDQLRKEFGENIVGIDECGRGINNLD